VLASAAPSNPEKLDPTRAVTMGPAPMPEVIAAARVTTAVPHYVLRHCAVDEVLQLVALLVDRLYRARRCVSGFETFKLWLFRNR